MGFRDPFAGMDLGALLTGTLPFRAAYTPTPDELALEIDTLKQDLAECLRKLEMLSRRKPYSLKLSRYALMRSRALKSHPPTLHVWKHSRTPNTPNNTRRR